MSKLYPVFRLFEQIPIIFPGICRPRPERRCLFRTLLIEILLQDTELLIKLNQWTELFNNPDDLRRLALKTAGLRGEMLLINSDTVCCSHRAFQGFRGVVFVLHVGGAQAAGEHAEHAEGNGRVVADEVAEIVAPDFEQERVLGGAG